MKVEQLIEVAVIDYLKTGKGIYFSDGIFNVRLARVAILCPLFSFSVLDSQIKTQCLGKLETRLCPSR